MNCKCVWVANSGMGGKPEFKRYGSAMYLMHAKCKICNTRSWFTEEQWNALKEAR